jgi:hypothetical protein
MVPAVQSLKPDRFSARCFSQTGLSRELTALADAQGFGAAHTASVEIWFARLDFDDAQFSAWFECHQLYIVRLFLSVDAMFA